MSVLVAGLNYKSAPLDLLERFSFDAAELPKALLAARASEHVREAVILSTGKRTAWGGARVRKRRSLGARRPWPKPAQRLRAPSSAPSEAGPFSSWARGR